MYPTSSYAGTQRCNVLPNVDTENSTTNVIISPVTFLMKSVVEEYFTKFGKIESIYFCTRNNIKCGVVQFESPLSASNATKDFYHNIDGYLVNVIAYSEHNILDILTNDCLLIIFERLTLIDLCSVADVCLKFKFLAQNVFRVRYSIVDLKIFRVRGEISNLDIVEKLFRNFGCYIKVLRIERFNESSCHEIIKLTAKYCSAVNCILNTLYILDIKIENNAMVSLLPIVKRLRFLYILDNYAGNSIRPLFKYCNELKKLSITESNFEQLYRNCRQLETLKLKDADVNDDNFRHFLQYHKNIKTLTITSFTWNKLSPNIMIYISNYLMKLEYLRIHVTWSTPENSTESYTYMLPLMHLKLLRLSCSFFPIENLLAQMIRHQLPLENLHLSYFNLTTTIAHNISKLIKITNLTFTSGRTKTDDLIIAIKGLPFLKKLTLLHFGQINYLCMREVIKTSRSLKYFRLSDYQNLTFSQYDYIEIVNLIKVRDNIDKLKIKFFENEMNVEVPQDVLDENFLWLEIESGFN